MKMNKKILSVLFVLFLCVTVTIPVFADQTAPRLVDEAGLLTDSESRELLSTLDEISQRQQFDVIVLTVDSLDGKTPTAFANDYSDRHIFDSGAAQWNILFLISMDGRDYAFSTHGYGTTAFTDAGIDYITDKVMPYLEKGEYGKAFSEYAALCDEFITQAKSGQPYDIGNLPRAPFNTFMWIIVSLVGGVLISLGITGSMKNQLKSVRQQGGAGNYVKANSLNITESRDIFLYNTVTRSEKPKSNSSSGGGSTTHTSSSGETHGGSSGKF